MFENIVFLGGVVLIEITSKGISMLSMAISALVPMQLLERMSILSEIGKLSRQWYQVPCHANAWIDGWCTDSSIPVMHNAAAGRPECQQSS